MSEGVLFIVGSGTSVEVGAPSFNEFNHRVNEVRYDKSKILADDLKEAFKFVSNSIKLYPQSNIEEIFSFTYLDKIMQKPKKEQELKFIQQVIGKTIYESLIFEENSIAINHHNKLIKNIQQKYGEVSMISLNWDVLFDKAFLNTKAPLDRFFKDADNTDVGILNYGFPIIYGEKEINPKGSDLLLKPHGSMNWGFCEKCGGLFFSKDKLEMWFDPSIKRQCYKCNQNNLKPILVPPIFSKLSQFENKEGEIIHSLFSIIWRKMEEKIKNCRTIVIIGYSFPKTDIEFLTFFKKAIYDAIGENKNQIKDIFIIDPFPEIIKKRLSQEFEHYTNDGITVKSPNNLQLIKSNSINIHSVKITFQKFVNEFESIYRKFPKT